MTLQSCPVSGPRASRHALRAHSRVIDDQNGNVPMSKHLVSNVGCQINGEHDGAALVEVWLGCLQ